MAKKTTRRLLRKDIRRPEDTGHSVADIAEVVAAVEPLENSKDIRSLPRDRIVIAEKVFQWRFEDAGARDDHILDLANTIAATEKTLDAILVFYAGDKFYVVDGHHRLAAYDTARWAKAIPVTVGEGSLKQAREAGLKFNSKNTRNLSRQEKQEAAWQLGKEMPRPTRDRISELTGVSPSSQDGMRRILKRLRDAGEAADAMTYVQALRKQWPDDEAWPKWDAETWMAEKADKLAKKFEAHGLGFMLREDHEVAAMALERVDARLTHSLIAQWLFRPENEDLVTQFLEERDSVEPTKF